MSLWLKLWFHSATAVILPGILPGCATAETEIGQKVADEMAKSWAQITITYDNNPYDDRLSSAWGFSCVIKLTKRVILFDSGGGGAILLSNMEKLGIDLKKIDLVILSHIHGDHVGGLASFLGCHSDVTVYMPTSFTRRLKDEVRLSGARLDEVGEARELFDGAFTMGELDGGIKEQSLVLKTSQGSVVITGCAHPGVVNIVRKAKEICQDKVYLILGGFHLGGASVSTIEAIIQAFVELGVQRVAPCHCSGERARRLFQEHFGPDYVECGVGSKIWIPG